jgi:hypothetical protein
VSKSCQKVVKKLSKNCQKVVKKLSKKLSKSCHKIVKVVKLSNCQVVKFFDASGNVILILNATSYYLLSVDSNGLSNGAKWTACPKVGLIYTAVFSLLFKPTLLSSRPA